MTRPDTEPTEAPPDRDAFRHGYPPPRREPGSVVVAYCGVPIRVEGAVSTVPPADACPLCVAEWQRRTGR